MICRRYVGPVIDGRDSSTASMVASSEDNHAEQVLSNTNKLKGGVARTHTYVCVRV
jgi:hypothetical protein